MIGARSDKQYRLSPTLRNELRQCGWYTLQPTTVEGAELS